tara:strand:- start:139 stop:258 length:120 start_codon:yes stop_codon:yes gene_type:complete
MNSEHLQTYMPIINRAIWLLCLIQAARAAVSVLEILASQ